MRILSLLPAATETVCALGLESALVGRSHVCDWPPTVRSLPSCTDAALNEGVTGCELDHQVKDRLRRALSIFRLDGPGIQALRPTIVVTQAQCEVCAVSMKELETLARTWLGAETRLHSFTSVDLASWQAATMALAECLGVVEVGRERVRSWDQRMKAIAAAARPNPRSPRPRVACLEWFDPPMGAGNWVPELVRLAGGEPVFGEPGRHSPWLDLGALEAADPDVLVLVACGWGLDRARREAASLSGQSAWPRLRAVHSGSVYLVDGNQFFNRPGPRLVESLEILAEILGPGRFDFGHRGRHWVPWEEEARGPQ